jgi:hypothetical protein
VCAAGQEPLEAHNAIPCHIGTELQHSERRHAVGGIIEPSPYGYLQEIKGGNCHFPQHCLQHGADERALRRNRPRQQVDCRPRRKALDLGDVLVTDGHRSLRLVADRGGAALIKFDQQLAGNLQRSEELLQRFEHLAFSQALVHRPQCRICRLCVGNLDLRIGEIGRGLSGARSEARDEQRVRDCASTRMHRG